MSAGVSQPRKRVKWEPAAAMVLVLLLGLWLALGPNITHKLPTREGATLQPMKLAESRGVVEVTPDPATGQPRFRVLMRDGFVSEDMSAERFRETFGEAVYRQATAARPNRLFRLLNITSWASLVWIGIGLVGQLAFSSRFLVQWLVSEKSRRAVVPESFWWMSMIGGIALFAYFIWRQDPIGILGQSSGLVIYARNLRLIYKHRRREARAALQAALHPPQMPRDTE